MGVFTWTFADKANKDALPYGGVGYIACPDGTFIETKSYNGYGRFGGFDSPGVDIYDLVVDWNKPFLGEIVVRLSKIEKHFGGPGLVGLALAYQNDDKAEVERIVTEEVGRCGEWFRTDWKRNIGIMIACEDEDNAALPYPIKIVSKPVGTYKYLPPSFSTQ